MPVIKNQYLKQFTDGFIDLVNKEQFEEWLTNIAKSKLPRHCTTTQARALFICLFYSGRRPSEIADLKGSDIKKIKEGKHYFYQLAIKTLKNGKSNPIFLPVNEHTTEMYTYIINRPPTMYSFWAFRKENRNTVKWKAHKTILVKETNNGEVKLHREPYEEVKTKTYIRKGDLIGYYSKLWTGRPAYWFRHHRYSAMYAHGSNDAEVQLFKGAKDPKSINAYKHMSKRMAISISKTFKF